MSQTAWKELAATFRKGYTFPTNAAHSWFPGHMHKSLKVMQRRLTDVDCVIEVHDARIPLSGRNLRFRDSITGVRPHILLLNKKDMVSEDTRDQVEAAVREADPAISKVIYTNCKEGRCPGVQQVLPTAVKLIQEANRYHRQGRPDKSILVIGIPNVGKSTLINRLRSNHLKVKGKPAPVGARPGITRAVQEKIRVSDEPLVYLLDTPGIMMPFIRDMHMGMKLALTHTLQDHLVGEIAISDYLLWWLNKNEMFSYVDYMKLEEPMDNVQIMLAHAAINNQLFTTKKDLNDNQIKRFPNLTRAAETFISGFRSGKFGLINLDQDKVNVISNRVEKSSRS